MRKPKKPSGQARITRIGTGTGWQSYDGDAVARDASERRRKTDFHLMLSWIVVLEGLIVELPTQQQGNIQPLTHLELQAIKKSIFILKHKPAPADAKAAASTLKKIKERLGTYLDAFFMEASKEGGKRLVQALGIWYVLEHILKLVATIF